MLRPLALAVLLVAAGVPASATPINPDPEIGILGGEGFSTLLSDALLGVNPENRDCQVNSSGTFRCFDLINNVEKAITSISGYFVNPACSGASDPDFVRDCLLSLHRDSYFDTLQTAYEDDYSQLYFLLSDSRNRFILGVPGCTEGQSRQTDCPRFADFLIFGVPLPPDATLTITGVNATATIVPEPGTLALMATGLGAALIRQARRKVGATKA